MKAKMADSKCHICGYVYYDVEDGLFHGYDHFGLSGLHKFALAHRTHIMKPFDMTAYNNNNVLFTTNTDEHFHYRDYMLNANIYIYIYIYIYI